jgi:hypothetical protein
MLQRDGSLPDWPPIGAEHEHRCAHEIDLRVIVEVVDLAFQSVRVRDVVRVHQRYQRASRYVDELIEPHGSLKAAPARQHVDATVGGRGCRRDLGTPVLGSIVHQQQLPVHECLLLERRKRRG